MNRVITSKVYRGILFEIVEEGYHYVFYTNGMRGFSSTDLERVINYMNSITR